MMDTIKEKIGETGMTDYQFRRYEELKDKCTALEQELEVLRGSGASSCCIGMTDYQYKVMMKLLYQSIKAKFEAGASQDEILKSIEDFGAEQT